MHGGEVVKGGRLALRKQGGPPTRIRCNFKRLRFSVSWLQLTQLKSPDSPPTYRPTQALRSYIYCDTYRRICQRAWLPCQRQRVVASPAGPKSESEIISHDLSTEQR